MRDKVDVDDRPNTNDDLVIFFIWIVNIVEGMSEILSSETIPFWFLQIENDNNNKNRFGQPSDPKVTSYIWPRLYFPHLILSNASTDNMCVCHISNKFI